MHADNNGKLFRDIHQNCDAFHIDSKSKSIIFERSFDTCDRDDYVIEVKLKFYYTCNLLF